MTLWSEKSPGAALISDAMHFVNEIESGERPAERVYAVLISHLTAQQERIDHSLLSRLRSDPLGTLERFRDEQEKLERQTPSTTRSDSRRVLSDRETAIFVSRALTYPDADDFAPEDSPRPSRVRARQTAIVTWERRETILYRRFDSDRKVAASGLYWRQFVSVLCAFLGTELNSEVPPLSELPDDARRLLRLAGEYERELGERVVGTPASPELHVKRDIEDQILDTMRGEPKVVIVRGDAGAGKSSVLWSLASQLRSHGFTPVLISATWLVRNSSGHILLDVQALISNLIRMRDGSFRPVLLLDTADLLLHSETLIMETIDLIGQLESGSIPLLITVRPIEERQLPLTLAATRVHLGGYSDNSELPRALNSLMRRFLPDHDPLRGTDLLQKSETRGLPLLEVLRSPFLLRMLFELSEGELPSTDLDVSALYERYWQLRIVTDQRSERYAEDKDLTAVAARLGILMLADATPAITYQRAETTLPQVALSVPPPPGIVQCLQTLRRRGVLVGNPEELRFAHQVLFEFIAAKALLLRDGASSLAQLVAHIEEHPHDLFTGAVVEQLLILLARDSRTRSSASETITQLLGSPAASLRSIGVLGWCHVPNAHLDQRTVESFDNDTILRLLGHLPQVTRNEPRELLDILRRLWPAHRDHAHRSFVECLARLARRWPTEISALVVELDIIGYLVTHQRQTLETPEPTFDLLTIIIPTQAVYVRARTLTLLTSLPTAAGRIQLLGHIAEKWYALDSDDAFLNKVLDCSAETARAFPSLQRDIGLAAGAVVFQQLNRREGSAPHLDEAQWEALARNAFDRIGSTPPPISDAAELHAISVHLSSQAPARNDHIQRILHDLFGREANDGPPYIVGPFLVHLLQTDSTSRHIATDLLYEKLAEGLPARTNADSSSAERWAITARSTLLDMETPPQAIAAIIDGLHPAEPRLWRSPDYLLGALVPAALAGEPRASALLHDIDQDPTTLIPADGQLTAWFEFIQQAPPYVEREQRVSDSLLSVAIATKRYGVITALLSHAHGIASVRKNLQGVSQLIEEGINATDSAQNQAAMLLRGLQEEELIAPTVSDIEQRLAIVRDPLAKATITEMLPMSVKQRPSEAIHALNVIRTAVIDPIRSPTSPAELTDLNLRLVDAGFSAYRAILSTSGEPTAWEPLWQLTRELPLKGAQTIDTTRFNNIATYLRTYQNTVGDSVGTAEKLVEVATWTAQALTPKQSKVISQKLSPLARQLVHDRRPTVRRILGAAAPRMPRYLGHAVIIATIAAGDDALVRELLDAGTITGYLANVAIDRLKGHREAGFQPMPWLITGQIHP